MSMTKFWFRLILKQAYAIECYGSTKSTYYAESAVGKAYSDALKCVSEADACAKIVKKCSQTGKIGIKIVL